MLQRRRQRRATPSQPVHLAAEAERSSTGTVPPVRAANDMGHRERSISIVPKVEAKLQPGLLLLRRTGLRMQAVNPIMMARIWRFGEGAICRAIIGDSATKMMTTTSFMGRADNCYVVFLDILTTLKCNAAL